MKPVTKTTPRLRCRWCGKPLTQVQQKQNLYGCCSQACTRQLRKARVQ